MNGKTIKEMATELGVDKQRVYRFIKRNHIREAYSYSQTMYYDANAQNLIKRFFTEGIPLYMLVKEDKTPPSPAKEKPPEMTEALLTMLRGELEIKNQQIEQLNELLKEANAGRKRTTRERTEDSRRKRDDPPSEIPYSYNRKEEEPTGRSEPVKERIEPLPEPPDLPEEQEPAWEPPQEEPAWEPPQEEPELPPEAPTLYEQAVFAPQEEPPQQEDDLFAQEDTASPITWGDDKPIFRDRPEDAMPEPDKPKKGLFHRFFGRNL